MSVEQTYSWLRKAGSIDDLAHYIIPLFSGAEKKNWKGILGHLQHHGMFKNIKEGIQTVSKLKEKGFYGHIQKEEQYLKNKWQGPDVPIVTLPVDERNRRIRLEFGSKSGLAFQDKMFLFLSSDLDFGSVSALMTHEYHHVCRLGHLTKEEKDVTLLDTIIMEGLAEYAVYERFGRSQTAEWTTWYTPEQLQALYEKKIAHIDSFYIFVANNSKLHIAGIALHLFRSSIHNICNVNICLQDRCCLFYKRDVAFPQFVFK